MGFVIMVVIVNFYMNICSDYQSGGGFREIIMTKTMRKTMTKIMKKS